MSLKLALKALKSLGLTDVDAQAYVYLSKKGPLREGDLADALNLTKHQLCLSLERLVTRGMVSTIPEHAIKYFAIPFEKILDKSVKAALEQVKALQASKKEILSSWHSMIEKNSSNS